MLPLIKDAKTGANRWWWGHANFGGLQHFAWCNVCDSYITGWQVLSSPQSPPPVLPPPAARKAVDDHGLTHGIQPPHLPLVKAETGA